MQAKTRPAAGARTSLRKPLLSRGAARESSKRTIRVSPPGCRPAIGMLCVLSPSILDLSPRMPRVPIGAPELENPIRGPAADLSEQLVVFLSGLQDPNRETSRQQRDGRPRHGRRANDLSPQDNRH